GFPEHLRAGEDTVVNQELFARGYRARRVQEIVLVHRSRCETVPRLLRHHFQRGRALHKIVRAQGLPLRRRLEAARHYLPARMSRSELCTVPPWGSERFALPALRLPSSANTVAVPGSDSVSVNASAPPPASAARRAEPALIPIVGGFVSWSGGGGLEGDADGAVSG